VDNDGKICLYLDNNNLDNNDLDNNQNLNQNKPNRAMHRTMQWRVRCVRAQGDSGSGLFCRYPDTNQFYVAGVVSFGIECATPKLPGVYTSVPMYADWIRRATREAGHAVEG